VENFPNGSEPTYDLLNRCTRSDMVLDIDYAWPPRRAHGLRAVTDRYL
jgi:hypothetical protein